MNRKGRAVVATAMLILLVINSFPFATVVGAVFVPTQTPTTATKLLLSIVPQRLPADGKAYPAVVVGFLDKSGAPSLALNSTTVYLTSSQTNVASVPPSVVIVAGQGYSIVNLTTSLTGGTSVLTASATGIGSAQATVQTQVPSGFATHLKVVPEPGSVLSRPGGVGSLVIQLQDQTGAPAKAAFPTTVSLSSSNNAIAQPNQKTIVVPEGADLAVVNYTGGYTIGAAFVTASASGFNSGTTQVTIVGSPPFSLRVSTQPNQVVLSGFGRVVVWLQDPSGNPARAPSPITISLTSSNLTVASIPAALQKVTIQTGQIYTVAGFNSTSTHGTSTITASAQGLLSGFDTVTTFKKVHGPAELKLFVAPDPVLADNTGYSAVSVSIANATGFPNVATSDTVVNLTSSSTSVGAITESVTIPTGKESVVASLHSTFLVGSTVLTASAQGLVSAQLQATSFGPIPASVLVLPAAKTLPADGSTYPALAIVLQDALGNPAVAPSDTVVQIASSRPSLLSVNSPLIIKAGQTYALANVQTGLSAGSTNVTVSASGYAASSTLVNTEIPAPSKLVAYVGPSTTINSSIGPNSQLTVQLQDINGFPAQARQSTSIVVTSSNKTLFTQPIMLAIAPGGDYATSYLSSATFGTTNLTASSAGLASSSVSLFVLKNPVNFTVLTPTVITLTGAPGTVSIRAFALNHPLKGAKVVWTSKAGTLAPNNSTTDATGVASSTFTSNTPVNTFVFALVSTPFAKTINLTIAVDVVAPIPPKQPSLADQLGPYLYIIIAVVVVVIAVVLFFFWRRRRKAKAGVKAEETRPYDELEEMPEGGAPVSGESGSASADTGGEATSGMDQDTTETQTGPSDETL